MRFALTGLLSFLVATTVLGQTVPATVPPAPPPPAEIPTPSQFLGIKVGADRTLADYRQIVSYFKALDTASPRMEIEQLGETTLGESMIMAVISSEENLRNKSRLQEIARRLADPRGLSDPDASALIREGKVILLVTCNIHSTEIASSQFAMEWAHALATAEDAETKKWLDDVVLLLVPSLNPDGQMMETSWYRKNLGTKFEGMRMPWLYHHYVGHDNNRDWYMLTQKETRAMNRAIYHRWFPQIFLDEHQMGQTGPRIFVPPYAEPVDPDIHPLIWRDVNLIGANMAMRLEQAEKAGVIYGYAFDAYWPGGTKNTGWWKNISGLLTEVASVRIATPMFIDPSELAGGRKGLIEHTGQTNFPNPWKGGWWRLRDIMDYERLASDALLEACSTHRDDFLRNMLARSRAAVSAAGPREAYRIPSVQYDTATARRLVQLMLDHNVEVWRSEGPGLPGGANDFWIPLAQPYGKFVREMFEPQRYPEVKGAAGKEIIRPYDVAAWSLPLMMGVKAEMGIFPLYGLRKLTETPAPLESSPAPFFAIAPGSPENAKVINALLENGVAVWRSREAASDLTQAPVPIELPGGTIFFEGKSAAAVAEVTRAAGVSLVSILKLPEAADRVKRPRVGLFKPWAASMDEGWTRWVLEQYGFDPVPLDNKTVRAGGAGLSSRFDVIVLPDLDREVILTGQPKREEGEMRYFIEFPPEFKGGLEKEGVKALEEFVSGGGTLVTFDSSSNLVTEEWNVPVRNLLAKVKGDDFSSPGSLLRVKVNQDHPVTLGIPAEVAIFLNDSIAFETTPPGPDVTRTILASYPPDGRDILLSGWIRGEERLAKKSAAVALTYGKGKIVLLGFRPQHRAQTHVTFPFLFNSIYWSTY